MIKLSLDHTHDDSEQKRPLSRRFAGNLKNARPIFFKIIQMQFVSMLSIFVHPCVSVFPFGIFLSCCSTVLHVSGYCNVSFYFLGILGVMKLHHSEAHGMFKVGKLG